ncbi:MAG: site-specific DNA-methyltransferase [Bacteroidales bacterium]|nr:site-specific DNA-methyltransferase [Bacteroidales bacterium]
MPTLQWIGKEAVVSHADKVPFRVLERKYTFGSIRNEKLESRNDGDDDQISNSSFQISNSKIIHGDNLEALKALLPQYEGKIKCIYIDPPYNTGNENWVYNDNVNSPRIKKWLGQVVGKEAEDLTRHDKWLCMMYPRLVLLQKLLSPDGAIFISIDDNEQANLKLICDEIFGAGNFVGEIIIETATDNNPSQINTQHEYMLCYCQSKQNQGNWKRQSVGAKLIVREYNKLKIQYSDIAEIQNQLRIWIKANKKNLQQVEHYNNVDEKGVYSSSSNSSNPHPGGYMYDILHPLTNLPCPKPQNGWRWPKSTFEKYAIQDEVAWGEDHTTQPHIKKRIETSVEYLRSLIYEDNRATTKELVNIFDGKKVFDNPKPTKVLERIFDFASDKSSIILDSFAGSGTTAHAVLNLNKADGGNRKFILVEMEDYAETITAERVKRVIDGYGDTEGTGGGFDYYELGETIFNDDKNLNENIGEDKIREYIWFSETHKPFQIPKENDNGYFLGKFNNCGYWFYYQKDTATTLDDDFLKTMETDCEQYVIYADKCILPKDFMKEKNIIFKKIPRDVRKL